MLELLLIAKEAGGYFHRAINIAARDIKVRDPALFAISAGNLNTV